MSYATIPDQLAALFNRYGFSEVAADIPAAIRRANASGSNIPQDAIRVYSKAWDAMLDVYYPPRRYPRLHRAANYMTDRDRPRAVRSVGWWMLHRLAR